MLEYINRILSPVIEYQFGTWVTHPVPDPFWVGEYIEVESNEREENGYQETTFILTGTGSSWADLENDKKKITEAIAGRTAILPDGNGIAVYYGNAHNVPTGDAELKRIQVNLTVKEWSVN